MKWTKRGGRLARFRRLHGQTWKDVSNPADHVACVVCLGSLVLVVLYWNSRFHLAGTAMCEQFGGILVQPATKMMKAVLNRVVGPTMKYFRHHRPLRTV